MIRIRCQCGNKLKLSSSLVGKLAACPQCRHKIRIVASALQPQTDAMPLGGMFLVEKGPQNVGDQVYLAGDNPIDIGKGEKSTLCLRAQSVSQLHCTLVPSDYGWRIEDRDSTNGVYVNGRRVRGHNLLDGDVVHIGEFELLYLADPAKKRAGTKPTRTISRAADGTAVMEATRERELNLLDAFPTMEETTSVPAPVVAGGGEEDEAMFRLAEGQAVDTGPPISTPVLSEPQGDGPVCPGCKRMLPVKAKICTQCGIDLRTGRSLLTSQETGLDEIYNAVERVIWWISWVSFIGMYPVASEAYGSKKPYVVRGLAVLTIVVSMWFLSPALTTGGSNDAGMKDLQLWAGDGPLDPESVEGLYTYTDWGDSRAYRAAYERIDVELTGMNEGERILTAHASLEPEQRCLGQYRDSQLITHAFLHADILHLAGNLLFLFVFGSRVNALIGNLKTAIVYPLLAAGAGIAHVMSVVGEHPHPMIGASGAVMGLAGMYFVFFPSHKVHVAAWWRWGWIRMFALNMKIFSVRGFWVVLFYIACDVAMTVQGAEDGVAHWAHLGGFGVGVVVALALMVARLVDARGGDIVTRTLGRHAWALVGRPGGGQAAAE